MRVILPILLLLAQPATAQPLYKSMAQCAGLMRSMEDLTRRDEIARTLDLAAAIWVAEAKKTAPSPFQVEAWVEQTRADWTGRGGFVVFSRDFTDWTNYCGALGLHLGLSFPSPPESHKTW